MTSTSETYHAGGDDDQWLADTPAVCMQILELADRLADLDVEVEQRRRHAGGSRGTRDSLPTRSGGFGAGSPTSQMHDFTTGEDGPSPDAMSIPTHSDPTGEAAVRDQGADELGRLRRRAFSKALDAMRALEAGIGDLSQAWPSPSMDDKERDRTVCWLCQDAGISVPIVVNGERMPGSTAGANGRPPLCRSHADFFRGHGFDPPAEAAEIFNRVGSKLTTQRVQQWIDADKERKTKKRKNKKGRR